ncbi:MAG: protein kinase domain-containing protein [Thermoguttaceae bacterium]
MSWPLPSELRAALKNPRIAFRDPKLQACTIEMTESGEPQTWSGSFAVVYKANLPDGTPLALRTFKAESLERRERYDWIAKYLKDHKLPCLVDFQYHDSGVRLPGDEVWYPLMVMDWVEGATLLRYVRARCLEGKASSMAKAARHWAALVQELAKAQVVHGDLEPANVLVTKTGKLKVVDYDNMCVPALIGLPSLEVGTEPYRHPRRITATPLSPELDNFAALVIYTSLRALAAVPRLWVKHVEQLGRDTLLFHGDDFRDPDASSLFRDLRRSPEREVRRLAKIVFKAADAKLNQTPSLAEVLQMISAETPPRIPHGKHHTPRDVSRTHHAERDANRLAGKHNSKVVLQVVSGPIQGQEFVFNKHDTFLFGRGEDCHARISGDPQVSRHHFLLEVVPPHVRIRDLGSRNGTYVNSERYGNRPASLASDAAASPCQTEVDLKPGDRITVGSTMIVVRIEPSLPAGAPETRPVEFRASAPQRAVVPGSGLSAYEITDAVGSGPLGTVYRAFRKSDGRLVAVKIVRPADAVSEAEGSRFLQGIESLRNLQHPGIASVLEMGWAKEDFYFVTQYCSGKSLTEAMASRGGRLTLAEARPMLLQCLAALEHAHQQGFVHRDLKPQNILLENRAGTWFALISDFGLAKHFELAGFSGLTAIGSSQLGHRFMPREQLTGFQNCVQASDLWSLAATFYHALTGQYPYDFENRDPLAVVLHDHPVPLATRNPSIPPLVAAAIDLALRSDPAARFPSAGAMIVALEQAFAQAAGGLR